MILGLLHELSRRGSPFMYSFCYSLLSSYYLRGAYRKVVAKLQDFSWDFKTYASISEQIIFGESKPSKPSKGRQDKGNAID